MQGSESGYGSVFASGSNEGAIGCNMNLGMLDDDPDPALDIDGKGFQ